MSQRDDLLTIYHAALQAVHGRTSVRQALQRHRLAGEIHLVAIGKAASAMALGAHDALNGRIVDSLVITKQGYADAEIMATAAHLIEAGHPTPDRQSIAAGQALLNFIHTAPADVQLLFLISGGASSLVELLPDGVTLDDLQQLNQWLLASGLDIHAMNHVRKSLSLIKGGRLARQLGGRKTLALLISDVPGDDPATIGSGLLVAESLSGAEAAVELPPWINILMGKGVAAPSHNDAIFKNITLEIVANLDEAKQAAAASGRQLGYEVYTHPDTVEGDVALVARELATALLNAPAGLHIWGGETTLQLPPQPGRGGRNQHLALVAAAALTGAENVLLLAAASDGSDGPTDAAGGLVDGETVARGVGAGLDLTISLARADAGPFLAASGDLVSTGPTGTNVMDLMLGLKW